MRQAFIIPIIIILGLVIFAPGSAIERPQRVAGLAAPQPPVTHALIPAQDDHGGDDVTEHTTWEGRNWGLVGAMVFSGIALSTTLVIVGVVFSWPHRQP